MEISRPSLHENERRSSLFGGRGSVAFTRGDRGARFEVDVPDENEHMLLQTPIDLYDENEYTTNTTSNSSFTSHVEIPARPYQVNTQYSARPTMYDRLTEEQKSEDNTPPTRQPMTLAYVAEQTRHESAKQYKGRLRIWPGLLLLFSIVALGAAAITLGATKSHKDAAQRLHTAQVNAAKRRAIQDGLGDDVAEVDVDGLVNNPKTYSVKKCKQPNYLSKDGKIIAVSPNGTQIPVGIKGVNWFGMETKNAVPFGLWQNDQNGTTVFDIASFLDRNQFNSVRIPVSVGHILDNTAPTEGLVNRQTNRALNLKNYMTTLQSIIQALGYRQISVLISLHTLLPDDNSGGLWYDANIPEDKVLKAIDMLAAGLCSDDYWNVIGIDLKNEPSKATWGDEKPSDWRLGSQKLGNQMLKGCPKWVGFVEGISGTFVGTMDDKPFTYYNWWGGGLQLAGDKGVKFDVDYKVVYSPHFYTTAVSPQDYFYDGKWQLGVELSDDRLRKRVADAMYQMFGYLATRGDAAVVMGEFGGLYAKDLHPQLTTKRTTDFTIEAMVQNKYAGGYMWSMNPESAYQYNPTTKGTYTEGLLNDDWLTPNKVFIQGMVGMNAIPNMRTFPCFFDNPPS
ncbi:hypothetical protein AC1031_011876 [Aphanomyces cochlioides]|nr:hypothetical protein AC1031_011876 [Aphanomyces cochlioides]